MLIVGKAYLILFICAALDCNGSSPATPSSRHTTRSGLCACGLLNDGTIVTPSSLRAGIHDASLQGLDVIRRVDALEAGVGALGDGRAVTQAAVECQAPGTYEDDLRYNGGPIP